MLHTLFVCIGGVIGNTAVSKTASLWFESILMCFLMFLSFGKKRMRLRNFMCIGFYLLYGRK